jgi:hypothetical protein
MLPGNNPIVDMKQNLGLKIHSAAGRRNPEQFPLMCSGDGKSDSDPFRTDDYVGTRCIEILDCSV